MINVITLNGDGTEAFRQQKPKGYRPRNGFTRLPNGDFVKELGSPFNISDIEIAEAIRKQQEEEAKRVEEAKKPKVQYVPAVTRTVECPKIVCKGEEDQVQTEILSMFHALTEQEWKDRFRYNEYALRANGYVYKRVSLKTPVGVEKIDKVDAFAKIEMVTGYPGRIRFWIRGNFSEAPDFVIFKGVKEYNDCH